MEVIYNLIAETLEIDTLKISVCIIFTFIVQKSPTALIEPERNNQAG